LRRSPSKTSARFGDRHFHQLSGANANEAIDRDVFGAPTYIYQDELFWGQDRLEFLDRALAK